MSNSKLSEAARKQRAEYYRKYRADHKEQIRETQRRYWERRAQREGSDQNAKAVTAE